MTGNSLWPELPLSAWSDTCETLRRFTQIAGKTRLATTPLVNHWWNVTFLVNSRGLAAPANICAAGTFDIVFDFVDHRLVIEPATAARRASRSGRWRSPISTPSSWTGCAPRHRRAHLDDAERDRECGPVRGRSHACAVRSGICARFREVLVQAKRVMNEFRARFIGKVSPVHFFWGSFDLAVTRFSGRTAPPPTGQNTQPASWVMAELIRTKSQAAASGRATAVTAAPRSTSTPIRSRRATATRGCDAGGLLRQERRAVHLAIRRSAAARDPDALLLGFLQETYAAAADLAKWDRKALERSG